MTEIAENKESTLPEDGSDVLLPRAACEEETRTFRANRRAVRVLRGLFFWNLTVLGLLVAEFAEGLNLLGSFLFTMAVLATLALLKFSGVLFLLFYWRTTDPEERRSKPWRLAAPTLLPFWDLFWYRRAYRDGVRAGIKTLEKIDGNRMRYRTATGLVVATWWTWLATVLCVLVCAGFLLFEHNVEPWYFVVYFSPSFFLMALQYGFITVDIVVGVAGFFCGVAAVVTRLGLLWNMLKIAEYASDAQLTTSEPLATETERKESRERAERLLAKTEQEPSDGVSE